MLNGVSRLINTYGDELKDELFKERLSKVSVKEVSRTAKDHRAGSLGYAEALLLIYNKKTHNPLRMEKLYASKKKKTNHPEDAIDTPDAINTESPISDGQMNIFSALSDAEDT